MISSSPFGPSALADLQARTAYEAWLLEPVYEISNQRIAVDDVDELIYPTSGAPPTQTIYGVGNIIIGDWRPGFLEAGAPLVLVTAFKLLDMLLEWVLAENGRATTHKFVQKIAALKDHSIQFPMLIGSRPWLSTRLTALYEQLEPLRGTIIHARHFQSIGGTLHVSGSKGGNVGAPVSLQPNDLRNLSVVLVSLLKYLDGTWTLDAFREKRIRRALDELQHLHGEMSLGQLEPGFLNVRVYRLDTESIVVDLDAIRRDINARRPHQDVVFDLRVVAIRSDGAGAKAFLVPWEQIKDTASPWARKAVNLAAFERNPPTDFDMEAAARDLTNLHEPVNGME